MNEKFQHSLLSSIIFILERTCQFLFSPIGDSQSRSPRIMTQNELFKESVETHLVGSFKFQNFIKISLFHKKNNWISYLHFISTLRSIMPANRALLQLALGFRDLTKSNIWNVFNEINSVVNRIGVTSSSPQKLHWIVFDKPILNRELLRW